MAKTMKKKTNKKMNSVRGAKEPTAGGPTQEQLMDMIRKQGEALAQMQEKILGQQSSAASAPAPKSSFKKQQEQIVTEPVPKKNPNYFIPVKVTNRKPGVSDISVPVRTKDINTAKVTATGGYHRLRYKLNHLDGIFHGDPQKGKAGTKSLTELHQKKLVEALAAFQGPDLQEKTAELVDRILTSFENQDKNLSDATRKAITAFRKKWRL